ncbi:hypothetical protein GCM10025768_20700 [Microbacterium pseudoresistens]|uniref:Helicase XPB/Ssl2 N-terminal domain-containing protein n=1 Tax=Microbacterium pseudoresistens TaxID=640634 RepID=A0A7Y9ESX3_9MICO|nr:helicase-associated domain-containing protein [Microbacterium pseudoresistens]NYD53367.1 hypothetical protein [Microbacterium pseudoresistens]
MSSHARALAEILAARRDDELAALLDRRGVRADADWHDFFDAAEALLDPASVARVLPTLSSAEAEALILAGTRPEGAGGDRAALDALALLAADGVPFPSVSAALAGRRPVRPSRAPADTATLDDASAARAAERAFTSVRAIADVLLLAKDAPYALLASGAVGMSEKRRAIEHGLPDDTDLLDDLFAIAVAARLLRPVERTLRLTTDGEHWLHLPGIERWTVLADAFRDALPAGVRAPEGGWIPVGSWASAHPWDDRWPQTVDDLQRRAALLGLVADGRTTPWSVPLAAGGSADAAALAALLPAEVDRIFLQNDLTAIAPGPLLPSLDLRLRLLARRESASQASSYRFTADGVAAAFAAGETEDSVIAFLDEISLTDVPQPLRYLVGQAAQRHGVVTVRTQNGTTRVESSDPHVLQAIGVDQALRPLGLVADGDALVSRVGRESVFWSLADEHYPATLLDADGSEERAARTALVDPEPADAPGDRYAPLIARLRDAQGPDAESAWLDRELDHAVRHRAVLSVTVAMPDDTSRELVLEVTGLGGGRLRGRDRAADVERTLPVTSIRTVRLLEDEA